ncbi:hypothetical protein MPL3365_140201 [Mesorhizobium plurifarium]|uniref:Uncharacterized protein n=1 Tax=Mesorhizobium plurifarium TaxID=69974 RepID=A0A090G496_MESPL|nr:hypothetical protein MPL3365_140201 [Mesorhizobium plurifarium]
MGGVTGCLRKAGWLSRCLSNRVGAVQENLMNCKCPTKSLLPDPGSNLPARTAIAVLVATDVKLQNRPVWPALSGPF